MFEELKEPEKLGPFKDKLHWMSNFYPVQIFCDGLVFPSVENAYQAQKLPLSLKDRKVEFISCTAAQAKALSREYPIKDGWRQEKVSVMKSLLVKKFPCVDTPLTRNLLETKNAILLHENLHNDRYWGVVNGLGANILGFLLMERRSFLFEEINRGRLKIENFQP